MTLNWAWLTEPILLQLKSRSKSTCYTSVGNCWPKPHFTIWFPLLIVHFLSSTGRRRIRIKAASNKCKFKAAKLSPLYLVMFISELISQEAATRGVLWKKLFLEISQNSQENTCARVSFLITLQAWGL